MSKKILKFEVNEQKIMRDRTIRNMWLFLACEVRKLLHSLFLEVLRPLLRQIYSLNVREFDQERF